MPATNAKVDEVVLAPFPGEMIIIHPKKKEPVYVTQTAWYDFCRAVEAIDDEDFDPEDRMVADDYVDVMNNFRRAYSRSETVLNPAECTKKLYRQLCPEGYWFSKDPRTGLFFLTTKSDKAPHNIVLIKVYRR